MKTIETEHAQAPVEKPLSDDDVKAINSWWHACNYLSVGMIYLRDNPLLRQPLKKEHVKQRLLGHWGASPALSFVWAHLNRMISAKSPDSRTSGRVTRRQLTDTTISSVR
jgi:xylulose-5-phosphate/fructose-6-phosphate phosphoketolase